MEILGGLPTRRGSNLAKKSAELVNALLDCPGCGQPLVGSRCDTCSGVRENDPCPGGCGRTKKACQAANGSGCPLR